MTQQTVLLPEISKELPYPVVISEKFSLSPKVERKLKTTTEALREYIYYSKPYLLAPPEEQYGSKNALRFCSLWYFSLSVRLQLYCSYWCPTYETEYPCV
ncbi:hypothetical protein NPIL_51681 [Nephila pilipes]|uniref:Uncharacterized protein n=1 Tax=Nephila pilipes TaxID=299642 RepID=A0A8X6Q3D0_NEPPI|nr:hypothetical protein NPIL_51681 [Nephila pilipes]